VTEGRQQEPPIAEYTTDICHRRTSASQPDVTDDMRHGGDPSAMTRGTEICYFGSPSTEHWDSMPSRNDSQVQCNVHFQLVVSEERTATIFCRLGRAWPRLTTESGNIVRLAENAQRGSVVIRVCDRRKAEPTSKCWL
jgi:hypothetical protein